MTPPFSSWAYPFLARFPQRLYLRCHRLQPWLRLNHFSPSSAVKWPNACSSGTPFAQMSTLRKLWPKKGVIIMSPHHSVRRTAFSLIELLVVVAIMAVLMGLLMPAVQKAREMANRLKCQNQIRQLTIAAYAYHNETGAFPPSRWRDDTVTPNKRWTQFVLLAPFMEQNAIYQQWDFTNFDNNKTPVRVVGYAIKLIVCPSDNITGLDNSDPSAPYGLTSFGGNAGTSSEDGTGGEARDGVIFTGAETKTDSNGITRTLVKYKSVRVTDVKDGTAATFLYGERNHFDPIYNQVCDDTIEEDGWWAYSARQDQELSTAAPLNYHMPSQYASPPPVNGSPSPAAANPPQPACDQRLSAFGSWHPEGANFSFVDGHAQFIRNGISQYTYQALSTRAGREIVNDDF